MKFIDWFAGIGGFRRGMELANAVYLILEELTTTDEPQTE